MIEFRTFRFPAGRRKPKWKIRVLETQRLFRLNQLPFLLFLFSPSTMAINYTQYPCPLTARQIDDGAPLVILGRVGEHSFRIWNSQVEYVVGDVFPSVGNLLFWDVCEVPQGLLDWYPCGPNSIFADTSRKSIVLTFANGKIECQKGLSPRNFFVKTPPKHMANGKMYGEGRDLGEESSKAIFEPVERLVIEEGEEGFDISSPEIKPFAWPLNY